MIVINRAKKRQKARKIMKKIMRNELHPARVNMTRKERRKMAWRLAKKRINKEEKSETKN